MPRNYTAPALSQFAADGFACVSEVLPRASLDAVIDAIDGHANYRSSSRGRDFAARNLLREVATVRELAESTALMGIAQDVLGQQAFPVRGTLFDKLLHANWHVGWHQDTMVPVAERKEVRGYGPWSVKAGVVHVKAPADVLAGMLTLRIHLDDCGIENGPLRVLPGSHQHGVLASAAIQQWIRKSKPVACLGRCGDALAMRPLLLHASGRAASAGRRRVLHLEYASQPLPAPLRWAEA